MAKRQFGYPQGMRLRKRKDYTACYAGGRKYHTAHFIVFVEQTGSARKTGMAVSRRVGGAVVRNRMKRLLREFFRLHGALLPPLANICVVVKKADGMSFQQAAGELVSLFSRLRPV